MNTCRSGVSREGRSRLTPLLPWCAVLLMTACVTTDPDGYARPEKNRPDPTEAARLNTELGVNYMRRGEFEAALEKLKRALDQNSDYAPAHAAVAVVHARNGDSALAEKHYRRALSLEPDNPSVHNNVGVFLCGKNRYEDAEEHFLEAANNRRYHEPENAWLNAGVCARRKPDLDKAEKYFREALKLKPELPEALAQMAWVCLQNKDYLRARAFLERYRKVGSQTPETLWVGMQTESALGDAAAARLYAERLKNDFPESDENRRSSQSPPT